MKAKCRCAACGDLVERWLGDVCLPCHDKAVREEVFRELEGRAGEYPILYVIVKGMRERR